jgi:hypothetical protein
LLCCLDWLTFDREPSVEVTANAAGHNLTLAYSQAKGEGHFALRGNLLEAVGHFPAGLNCSLRVILKRCGRAEDHGQPILAPDNLTVVLAGDGSQTGDDTGHSFKDRFLVGFCRGSQVQPHQRRGVPFSIWQLLAVD